MNKKLVMCGVFVFVFFISIIGSYKFINRNNQDSTIELSAPTLPLITMLRNYEAFNTLHGYTGEMDISDVARYTFPVGKSRELSARIEYFDAEVKEIRYEVRNINGDRLIESGILSGTEQVPGYLDISVKLKDLIDENEEYIFSVFLKTDSDSHIGYYTRFVYQDNFDLENQLEFVKSFHENTFIKEAAADIAEYMEPDKKQDNSSLSYVNIHSSVKQVVWGELPVTRIEYPDIYITYLQDNYGAYTLDYYVESDVDGVKKQYHVVENFLVSTFRDEIYLLDYERTADAFFDYEEDVYVNNTVELSIQNKEIPVFESEDGKMAAFVVGGTLYYYDDNENKMNRVYGFGETIQNDPRSIYDAHDIRVLQIDESGSIHFLLYGYMNRGIHEGKTGIGLYTYSGHSKLVEELGFYESTHSAEYVMQEAETMAFMSRQGVLYVCIEGNIFSYNINDGTAKNVIPYDKEQQFYISADNSCIAVQKNDIVSFWYLEAGHAREIKILEDGVIVPVGFINSDFVYGISEASGQVLQSDGTYAQYMKEIRIQDMEGEILKQYFGDGTLISECTIDGNQIILNRVLVKDGKVTETTPDQIVAKKTEREAYNKVESKASGAYQKIWQLKLKNKVNTNTLELVKAKEVFYEGERRIQTGLKEAYIYCSIHNPWRVVKYTADAGSAMQEASKLQGYALDGEGLTIWKKAVTVTKNQIMAIELERASSERSSLNICMDIMLREIGSPLDTSEALKSGKTCQQILAGSEDDYELLDITGSSLSDMLYYTNKDVPIMILYDDGNAVLITGFNQFNIVIMDPVKNKLGYMSRSDASKMLEETANQVFTYYYKHIN